MYNILPKGSQVKCWDGEMSHLEVGDLVLPSYADEYVVLLQEGGHVRVTGDVISEIIEDRKPRYPEEFTPMLCLDKWGDIVPDTASLRGRVMFGYNYYFLHERDAVKGGDNVLV